MNYEQAVGRLMALGRELSAPQQARVQKFDLENIRVLAESMGKPHLARRCAHIAGTNGKGSTAAMLDSILRAAGLRTGLYTSPHLERINERIRIDGEPITNADFAGAYECVQTVIEAELASGKLRAHPTYFECLTAMAYQVFARTPLDFAVYEVGMGGRLDATNIVEPEVAILTQIDFDHENFLGHSLQQIAAEKAGIVKPGAWVVSCAERPEAREIIARRCRQQGARLVEVDSAWQIGSVLLERGCCRAKAFPSGSREEIELNLSLPGRFQLRNALAAATAARLLAEKGLPVSNGAIARGIAMAQWPGRLEQLAENPAIFLDGTHNPAGARELMKFWDENLPSSRIILVYGTMRDKAVDEIAGLLFPRAEMVVITSPRQPRAISAPLLAEMAGHLARKFMVVSDPVEALERALEIAQSEDAIFVTGSLYLVGDLRGQRAKLAQVAAAPTSHLAGTSPSHR